MSKRKSKHGKRIKEDSSLLRWKHLLLLAVSTFLVYAGTFNNDFTNWDDDLYVTENPYITELSFESVKGFFTRYQNANYHPLTFVSLAIDHKFFGLDPSGYHLTNLLFHIANTILLYLLLFNVFKRRNMAFITALLFAVHPLHVESVAWVSERKDVLYTFFVFLGMMAYLRFKEGGGNKSFIYCLMAFLAACLSKGQAVIFPLLLVLIDYWVDKQFKFKSLINKAPFFVISIVFGLIAINAQSSADAIFDNASLSFFDRILFASYGFINYLLKLLVPFKLSAIYPYPEKGSIGWEFWLCLLLTIAMLFYWVRSYMQNRIFFWGLGFFLVSIIMVLQLIPVGNALMADRYTYLASVGVFIIIADKADKLWLLKKQQISYVIITAYTLFLGYTAFQRGEVWSNSLTLWEDTTEKYPEAEVAWNNLGSYHNNTNNYEAAIYAYTKAIENNPIYADAYSNRGMSKKNLGQYNESLKDLNKALELDPNSAFAHSTKGVALTYLNELDQAYNCFMKALEINPNSGDAYSGLGVVKTRTGRVKEALYDFNRSLELRPGHPETYSNRGIAKAESGDLNAAIQDFTLAIKFKEGYAGAYLNRGLTYMKQKKLQLACNDFYKASELGTPQANALIQQFCK